jgi:pimeloyl-ACP methyl ester carboxylesterase
LKIVFNDATFSLQLLRILGQTYYKGADIGECLSTAYRIREGDFESWHIEWLRTAKRIHKYADECLSKGHIVSARQAYLRASNYYRASEFLLIEPEDPRIQITWGKSKECFSKAAKLFNFQVEPVEIPYNTGNNNTTTTLPGYFYYYRNDDKNDDQFQYNHNADNNIKNKKSSITSSFFRPTLIAHGGFDSTLEELYFSAAAPALERGYNCLTFEGPGQGGVIRKQKIPFRADWEKVVSPVIDYVISKKEEYRIDTDRIALMGISMGGYLAARAVAFEHRISAVILYNGVYDGYDALKSSLSEPLLNALEEGNVEAVNSIITNLMSHDSNIRFNMKHGMWTNATNSPYELLIGSKRYTTKDILNEIQCPTLVLEAEKDDSFPGQPKKVFDGLTKIPSESKKYITFTEEEGAEEHCQCGAPALSNQRIFDWLDEIFGNITSQ